MDEDKEQSKETAGSLTYYVLGAVILAFIVAGVYIFRPKSSTPAPGATTATTPVEATPTRGPITGLACEQQWYNPVVGLPKYLLGVEGVDFMTTKKVTCDFAVSVAGKVVATASGENTVTTAPGRGGGTFRCDSGQLELEADVQTVVDVTVKNDKNEVTSCSKVFILPPP